MREIKISIVTVCYNAERYIENVFLSVKFQTYSNIEYIVVDGESNDGTLDVIKKYEGVISRWISEPDNGVYDAMNKALDLATGDFLLFLGADDHFISYDTISNAVQFMNQKDYVYYGDVYRNVRNDLYRGKFSKYLLACENICHQAIFYPKSVYKQVKYDLNYPIYADYIYNIRNWRKYTYKYIPVCIAYFNCTGVSGASSNAEKYSKPFFLEIKKNLGLSCYIIKILYWIVKRW